MDGCVHDLVYVHHEWLRMHPHKLQSSCHTCDVIDGCESRQTDSEGFCICNMSDKTEELDVH